MHRKVKLLTSPQDDDVIELEVKNTTAKKGGHSVLSSGHFRIVTKTMQM